MSRLLKQAQQRVEKVLRLVQTLKDDDFPHSDSVDTLTFVEKLFVSHREILSQTKPDVNTQRVIRNNCQSALDDVFVYLPVIGYVARSTDVVGALELHSPLHRIVKQIVGPKARLLLTSDWQYSPTTYLCPQLVQEGLVLVNLPASEADNGLTMPLAGHEIGHSVWYAKGLEGYFFDLVDETLVSSIASAGNFETFKRHFGPIEIEQIDDLAGRPYWEQASDWAISQCEETFCDFVGLLLFRESYIYAFESLLSPGGGYRDPSYPPIRARVRHLLDLAGELGILIDANYLESFQDETSELREKDAFLAEMSDYALEALTAELASHAQKSLIDYPTDAHSDNERRRVISAYERTTPINGGVHVMNLIAATWEVENSDIRIWDTRYPQLADKPEERSRILNELFLKSLEILEIENIQKEMKEKEDTPVRTQ